MTKNRFPFETLVCGALCGALAAVASHAATATGSGDSRVATWTAVAASGPVERRGPHALDEAVWEAVRRGDELPSLSEVRTGPRGRATLTRSASILIVDPNSRLELPEPAANSTETSVVQMSGSVLYDVDRRAIPHFEVVTPHLVAGVKGTTFLVTVEDGRTAVTVGRGRVELRNPANGDIAEVGPGESMFLDRGRPGFDRVGPDDPRPDARREVKRMARLERQELERRDRDSGDAPVDETVRPQKDDWISAHDAHGKVEHDWHDAGVVDNEHDESAFGDDRGHDGKGSGYEDKGHGKDDGTVDDLHDPANDPYVPAEEPAPVGEANGWKVEPIRL